MWDLTECQAGSGSNRFDTQMLLLKEFFEKVDFEKKSVDDIKVQKISQGAKILYNTMLFLAFSALGM